VDAHATVLRSVHVDNADGVLSVASAVSYMSTAAAVSVYLFPQSETFNNFWALKMCDITAADEERAAHDCSCWLARSEDGEVGEEDATLREQFSRAMYNRTLSAARAWLSAFVTASTAPFCEDPLPRRNLTSPDAISSSTSLERGRPRSASWLCGSSAPVTPHSSACRGWRVSRGPISCGSSCSGVEPVRRMGGGAFPVNKVVVECPVDGSGWPSGPRRWRAWRAARSW
jgi:hypothetical protein